MLKLILNFSNTKNASLSVQLIGKISSPAKLFIEALKSSDEQFIDKVRLNNLPLSLTNEIIEIDTGDFSLEYQISSPFKKFIGSHFDFNINYPYFNNKEVFIGSGVLPSFLNDPALNVFEVEFKDLPDKWIIASNLVASGETRSVITEEKIAQFFLYLSLDAQVYSDEKFKCIIGSDITLPVEANELFLFCKKSFKSYEDMFGKTPKIIDLNLLILQSPVDFDIISKGKTFSTAENYTGGIVFYGPDREDVYKSLGHSDYKDFILGGLQHEIGHAYTSAGPARFKSILYASDKCLREERYLIGEALNGYYNDPSRVLFDSDHHFSMQIFINQLLSKIPNGKRIYILDLFLFDCALRNEVNLSLYSVYKELLETKRRENTPYDSASILIEEAERISLKTLPEELKKLILDPKPSNYLENLRKELVRIGLNIENLPTDSRSLIDFFFNYQS